MLSMTQNLENVEERTQAETAEYVSFKNAQTLPGGEMEKGRGVRMEGGKELFD